MKESAKGAIKSKTMWLATIVGLLPQVLELLPNLKGVLEQYYGATYFVIAILIALSRVVTTKPLADK